MCEARPATYLYQSQFDVFQLTSFTLVPGFELFEVQALVGQ